MASFALPRFSLKSTQKSRLSPLLPALPAELKLDIFDHLTIKDLKRLKKACPTTAALTSNYSTSLATGITKRELYRLRADAFYLDFTGTSFVAAWHRYMECYGMKRDACDYLACEPDEPLFIKAYQSANPSKHLDKDDYQELMIILLGINDWLQFYLHGTFKSELAERLNRWGWAEELADAAAITPQFAPGRYAGLIEMFKAEIAGSMDPQVIIQAFDEVKANPLEDLGSLCWPFYERSLAPPLNAILLNTSLALNTTFTNHGSDSESESDSDSSSEAVYDETFGENIEEWEEPDVGEYDDSREQYQQFVTWQYNALGIKANVHGFHVMIWARSARAMELLKRVYLFGDRDGMMFAEALESLNVWYY